MPCPQKQTWLKEESKLSTAVASSVGIKRKRWNIVSLDAVGLKALGGRFGPGGKQKAQGLQLWQNS